MGVLEDREAEVRALPKCATGIHGLDVITHGGLPAGRVSLVCGSAGSGKTLLGTQFLVYGAREADEPGVFVSFEETAQDLTENVRSLGIDLDQLVAEGKLAVDRVFVDRSQIEESGEFDLEGLFIRLGYNVKKVGAKRVVLDTIESLFSGLPNEAVVRSELRRLFRWLKDQGLTTIVTGEKGEGELTRHGLEEYVSDCVVLLDQRVEHQVATRRLRVVKYRGSLHGTDEYPFLITARGFSVLPVSAMALDHPASTERISTGLPRLDEVLGGGLFRGSTVLISGTAGTGKSSIVAQIVDAACGRGERVTYLAMEESPAQIVRNMRSVSIDLQPWVDSGQLQFHATRAYYAGLEAHLVAVHDAVTEHRPSLVVVDPLTNLMDTGSDREVKAMLARLIDLLKRARITCCMTSLSDAGTAAEATDVGVSSLVDTWLLLRVLETNGERVRGLYVIKSRGTSHSSQVSEFVIRDEGLDLLDVAVGPEGVLTGSARAAQEAKDRTAALQRSQDEARRHRTMARRQDLLEARIAALRAEFQAELDDLETEVTDSDAVEAARLQDRKDAGRLRSGGGGG